MKILIASGGSGGHIFPALSVISELQKRGNSFDVKVISGRKDIEKNILKKRGIESYQISVGPFPRRPNPSMRLFCAKFIKAIFETVSIISNFKPDVVVGFGGYVSCPVIITARFFGIPTIIHEQNIKFGLANKLLKHFSTVVAVSYQKTAVEAGLKKAVFTGNPIRDDLVKMEKDEALRKLNMPKAL